jgi:hypothetical protein
MGATLEQILEKTKCLVLEKQERVHSLLRELGRLVPHGDALAVEAYFSGRDGQGGGTGAACEGADGGVVPAGADKKNGEGSAIYAGVRKREAVRQVLLKAAVPMTVAEVYRALVEGGYPFSGRNPFGAFRTEIYKYAVRVERGRFVAGGDSTALGDGGGDSGGSGCDEDVAEQKFSGAGQRVLDLGSLLEMEWFREGEDAVSGSMNGAKAEESESDVELLNRVDGFGELAELLEIVNGGDGFFAEAQGAAVNGDAVDARGLTGLKDAQETRVGDENGVNAK